MGSVGNPLNLNNFNNTAGVGAIATGGDVQTGNQNLADANDATLIRVKAANNSAVSGVNDDETENGVGVFGVAFAAKGAIGMLGSSDGGTGTMGISMAGGIGVAGRSGVNIRDEDQPLEELVSSAGILGQSFTGPGVRGHGGPLRPLKENEEPSNAAKTAEPGGVFSSGQLGTADVPGVGFREVGLVSRAQLRLTPCRPGSLPVEAQAGDMIAIYTSEFALKLFICVRGFGNKVPQAVWVHIAGDQVLLGGTEVT